MLEVCPRHWIRSTTIIRHVTGPRITPRQADAPLTRLATLATLSPKRARGVNQIDAKLGTLGGEIGELSRLAPRPIGGEGARGTRAGEGAMAISGKVAKELQLA